jgi:3',5'-cyclic AMP phosphodiesterase CpdA
MLKPRRLIACLALLMLPAAAPRVHADPTTRPAAYHIALVSDPHVSDGPHGAVYGPHFLQVIDEVNAAGVDAVLLGGDLTDGGTPEQMRRFAELAKTFRAPIVRFVPGNHDVGNKLTPGAKTSLTPRRLKNYQDHLGPLFFSADLAPGLRIIGITSSLLGSGLPEEAAQWDFLQKQLPPTSSPPPTTTLLLSHYPPIANAATEPNEYFNIDRDPRARLLALLDAAGVRTLLAGHLHRPVDYTLGTLHVIGAPAVSFGLPPRLQKEGWTLVTVDPAGACTAELHYLPRDPAPSR